MSAFLSVIIPTLQEAKSIGATLKALAMLRDRGHEIIVSDGGSTDETVTIARPLADKVILYTGAIRQTISTGRNVGARAACGKLLVFLDADCSIERPIDFFAAAVAHFERDSEVVALTGYLRVLPSEETVADKLVFGLMNAVTRVRNNVCHKGDAAGGEFQMVRREAFETVGGYREDLVTCEDRDLFARLARLGRVVTDPALVVFHSGRRAHNVGWTKLIVMFLVNTISFRLRGKALSREWSVER